MKLSTCAHQFFGQYLPNIRGVSNRTTKTYLDTFTLFLPYAARYYSINIQSLSVDHLSPDLIYSFLDYLEIQRKNISRTRNNRLFAIKSFARMIRLMYPEWEKVVERIMNIPKKHTQKKIIGFLYPDEILQVLKSVDLKKREGFRDYAILHLLYDSGVRASEIASLNIDYFDHQHKTIVILGKGNRYRLIKLGTKTVQLIKLYILKYRVLPKPMYRHRLFINQRREEFTRHGINRICKKYLSMALPDERVKTLNPVTSFRHSCAVDMLNSGYSIEEIRNRLGHQSINSTMVYLHLDLSRPREMQEKLNEYTQSLFPEDQKIEEMIDWENKEKIFKWLDSL